MIRCSTFSCAPRREPHLCLVDRQFRRIEKNVGEVSCSMLETSNGDNLKHSQLLDYCWSGESLINVLEWAFCCRCGNVWLRLWETIYHVQMTRTVANKDISNILRENNAFPDEINSYEDYHVMNSLTFRNLQDLGFSRAQQSQWGTVEPQWVECWTPRYAIP